MMHCLPRTQHRSEPRRAPHHTAHARRRRYALALGATLALTLTACKGEPPSAAQLRAHLERAYPGVQFEKETRIRLGRVTLALAKGVARLAVDLDSEERAMLSHVKRVDIAEYAVTNLPDLNPRGAFPEIASRLASSGWQTLLRERDGDAFTWLLTREDEDGAVRNLFIVELDDSYLTVVDLAGRLDRMVAEALADDVDGFVASL